MIIKNKKGFILLEYLLFFIIGLALSVTIAQITGSTVSINKEQAILQEKWQDSNLIIGTIGRHIAEVTYLNYTNDGTELEVGDDMKFFVCDCSPGGEGFFKSVCLDTDKNDNTSYIQQIGACMPDFSFKVQEPLKNSDFDTSADQVRIILTYKDLKNVATLAIVN